MSKIVNFPNKSDNVKELLQDLLERAEKEEITCFVFACKCTDKTVATAYGNADYGTRCELVGHIQADICWGIVKTNADLL